MHVFHNIARKLTILLILATVVACSPAGAGDLGTPADDPAVGAGEDAPGGQIDHEPDPTFSPDRVSALLDRLRAAGLAATVAGTVDQPFFTVRGTTLDLGGEQLQVFAYPDESSAASEASQVAPDGGSIGTHMVSWIASPHFYRDGELIAIYTGDNQDLLSALAQVLGPQFAGHDALGGGDEFQEPLPATLAIDGQQQIGGVGSYCWNGDGEVAVCADMLGIPTPREPITAGPAFLAQFELPLALDPMDASLTIISVTDEDAYPDAPGEWRWWPAQSGSDYTLPLSQRPEIELTLDPGLYLFALFTSWEQQGSVSYGFLVEVSGS